MRQSPTPILFPFVLDTRSSISNKRWPLTGIATIHSKQLFQRAIAYFPDREKYFIDSVRAFEATVLNRIERRGSQLTAAIHRREHRHYNQVMCASRPALTTAPKVKSLQSRIDARDEASRYSMSP